MEAVSTPGVIIPAFAEPHVHVDRAFSHPITGPNSTGDLTEAVVRFADAAEQMTIAALVPGCSRLLALLAASGVWHVRTHTAVGGTLGFRAWDAVELAATSHPELRVQQVAMPVDPNTDRPDVRAWLREAASRGAVAVGGAPWLARDPVRSTRRSAEIAAELDIGLDLHVDETDDPSVDTIPVLAEAVEVNGLQGRAVASHCCSMSGRGAAVIAQEADALAEAQVAVVICPVTNLSLQGRSVGGRGIAPVAALRHAEVMIGVGIDNVRDVVSGLGTPDPLRSAWLLALAAHLTRESDLTWLGEVVTRANRAICGVGESEGPRVLIEADDLAEAVALVPGRRRLAGQATTRGTDGEDPPAVPLRAARRDMTSGEQPKHCGVGS